MSKVRRAWLLLVLPCGACTFYARGADSYRAAVREVLDTRRPQVESCYRIASAQSAELVGKVTLQFDVAPKTGAIENAKVVEAESDSNPALQKCALDGVQALVLAPPDQRKGEAKFVWAFER